MNRPTEQPAIVGGVDHGLGPHAITLEDGEEGFMPVAVLVGGCVYIQQHGSQITMSATVAHRLAAALTARPSAPAEVGQCICNGSCAATEDGHWVNCPAHEYYANYLAYTRRSPAPAEGNLPFGSVGREPGSITSEERTANTRRFERQLAATPATVEPGSERAFRAGWEAAFDWYDNSGITEEWEAETAAYERFARPAADDAK